jgi:4-carboxymuconolactone decarboxylase
MEISQRRPAVSDNTRELGQELQQRMFGKLPNPRDDLADSFAYMSEFSDRHIFGELWQRSTLDLKTRSLCTVAAIMARGYRAGALQNHIVGALSNGATPDEIREVLAHTSVYAGIPLLGPAIEAAEEIFAATTEVDRQQKGPRHPE